MRQFLLDLYEIQKIDLSIREQEKRQEALPARLRELESSVNDLQTQIASITDRRGAIAKEAQSLRSLVEEEAQKIRKWESRLNDIRNQREYQALNRETEGSKRANRDADEKISELVKQRDALDADIEALKTRLSEAQAAAAEESGKVSGAVAALKTEIERDVARRATLVPRIPKPMFRKYDAIRTRRLGVGLCPVTAGCCTGCNMRLPPQLYNILQRGDSVEQCPSCHRLIFWDQILPAADEPARDGETEAAGAAS